MKTGERSFLKLCLKKKYADGLIGLEGFSHAVIIYFIHRATDKNSVKITRRPQGRDDMPFVGIFSQRAKKEAKPLWRNRSKNC